MPAIDLSRRVRSRLEQAEASEPNLWFRDDLKIARLTVLHAERGDAKLCSPHVLATYEVLGLHPKKVWPKIEARRRALLGPFGEEFAGARLPPKKPPAKVGGSQYPLWFEKTKGARAINSRARDTLLCDNTISLPMASPSIAALYPNPDAPSSAKKRQFSFEELLRALDYSGAPQSVIRATRAALIARGRWPNDDGPITPVICVSLWGMMLEGNCCRRTAQRRAKRACELGYWRRSREANHWSNCPKCGQARQMGTCGKCGYRGRARTPEGKANFDEFCRPHMYEIDVHKFLTAPRCREIRSVNWRTYAEYKAAAKRGEHPNVTEIRKPAPSPSPEPTTQTAPAPQSNEGIPQKAVVSTVAGSGSVTRPSAEARKEQPKLGRRDCAKFAANLEQRKRGRTSYFSRADGMMISLRPGDEGYSLPMHAREAFLAECAAWHRDPDVVRYALQFWGYQLQE